MKASRQTILLAIPFFLAAIWALGASLYILLAPFGTGMGTTMSTSGQIITQSVVQQSFYDVMGSWGVFLLAVFALLYISTALSALLKKTVLLASTSLVACALTIVSGFSIGLLYFPAMLAIIAGWMMLGTLGIVRLWQYCFRPFPAEEE
ncbi:MAG: hypothetical protein Q7K29_05890 [Thermoleophilia bacterium]|nr:hypothetical protein [Thermoleophilia bacterium]